MAVSPTMTVEEYQDKIQLAIAQVNRQSDKTVNSLYDLADELDKAQRKMNIAKTSFASGGIVAAALTIAGIACAPVTLGASLGLTVAGVTVGVTSGVGGLCTEIADKIINSNTLKKAQKEANVIHETGNDMLYLMDNMEARHTSKFKTFFSDTVKRLLRPTLFESIRNRLQGKPSKSSDGAETVKFGARVGVAINTAKVATEFVETGLKAGAKATGVVLNLLTVPLDIHTIVTNSIKIHKKTPSQTAEEIRRIADDLKGKEVSEPSDEVLKLRKTIEDMTRQQEKHCQTWEESKEKISEDITVEMEIISMEYEYVRQVLLKSKCFTLLVEAVLASVISLLAACLSLEGGGWVCTIGHGALLLYDVFLVVFQLLSLVYKYYCVYRAKSVLRQQTYAMEHMIKIYPRKPSKRHPREETNQHTLAGQSALSLGYKISNQNCFEILFVTLKCFLTIYILFGPFGYRTDFGSDQIDVGSPSETSYFTAVVGVFFPMSSRVSSMHVLTPDLYMLSLNMVVFLLFQSYQDLQNNIPSDLVEDLKNLADEFNCRLNALMECM